MANRPPSEKIINDGTTTYIKYYPHINKDGKIIYNRFIYTKPNKQPEKKQKADDKQRRHDLLTAIRNKLKDKSIKTAELEAVAKSLNL